MKVSLLATDWGLCEDPLLVEAAARTSAFTTFIIPYTVNVDMTVRRRQAPMLTTTRDKKEILSIENRNKKSSSQSRSKHKLLH